MSTYLSSLTSNKKRKSNNTSPTPQQLSGHKCYKCEQIFQSNLALGPHLRWCTGTNHVSAKIQQSKQWMPCLKCDRLFLTANALNGHMRHCKSDNNATQRNSVTYTKSSMDTAVKSGNMGITNNAYMGESYATQLEYQQSLEQMNNQIIHEHPDVEFEANIHDEQDDDAHQTEDEEDTRDESESIPLDYIQKMKHYEEVKHKQPLDRDAPEPLKPGNSFSAKALARIELLKIVQKYGGGEAMFDSIETWATHSNVLHLEAIR
eukprot:scaffold32564_cov43-Cyclotella_meneghiniana.AAC.2